MQRTTSRIIICNFIRDLGSHKTSNNYTEKKKKKQINQSFSAFSQNSQKHRTTYINRQACLSEQFTIDMNSKMLTLLA